MEQNIMGTLPIGKLLRKMSVPVILSMLVSALYSVIDSIFVARLGQDALTAMSLATPMSSFIACVTVGFSVGMNAELSKKLGEGDGEAANRVAGNGLLVEWLCAIVFMFFGLFLTRSFYALQTGDTVIQSLGQQYTSIVCIFSFGVASQVLLERMLVATGRSIGSMYSLLTGTIVNLALDPILIFGMFGMPAFGMRGAAIATVVAQISAALVALTFNVKTNKEIHFHFGMLKPDKGALVQIWKVGMPAAIQQAISPMMIFGMNQILLGFTSAAPAVYVIYVRLQSIFLIPIWGLKNTVVSIISYNYGAGYRERIQQTIRVCLIATIAITCMGIAVFQIMPGALLALFNAGGEVLTIGRAALRIVSFTFPMMGLTLIIGAFFQALGHSKLTMVTSISEFMLMMISATILSRIGTVYTVWFAFIITEAIVATIAILFMRKVSRDTIGEIEELKGESRLATAN